MFCEVYKSHQWRHGYPPDIRRYLPSGPSGPRVPEAGFLVWSSSSDSETEMFFLMANFFLFWLKILKKKIITKKVHLTNKWNFLCIRHGIDYCSYQYPGIQLATMTRFRSRINSYEPTLDKTLLEKERTNKWSQWRSQPIRRTWSKMPVFILRTTCRTGWGLRSDLKYCT